MFFEAETWVAVAFFIFAAILWKVGGLQRHDGGLDQRGKRIRAELDEAQRLREEAAKVLADYQRRRGEAEREAQDILAAARARPRRTADEAHRRMQDFVARRTRAAEAKIAQAETAGDGAGPGRSRRRRRSPVSETLLREKLAGDAAQDLVAKSLADVRRKLNA